MIAKVSVLVEDGPQPTSIRVFSTQMNAAPEDQGQNTLGRFTVQQRNSGSRFLLVAEHQGPGL